MILRVPCLILTTYGRLFYLLLPGFLFLRAQVCWLEIGFYEKLSLIPWHISTHLFAVQYITFTNSAGRMEKLMKGQEELYK